MKLTDVTHGGVILRRRGYRLGELVLSVYSDDRLPYRAYPVGNLYFTRVVDGVGSVSSDDETADDWETVKPGKEIVEANMAKYNARWVWNEIHVYHTYGDVLFRQGWAGSAISRPERCEELPDGGAWRPDIVTHLR